MNQNWKPESAAGKCPGCGQLTTVVDDNSEPGRCIYCVATSAAKVTSVQAAWERQLPETPQRAEERLAEFADAIERLGFHWPAAAIRARLSRLAHSLDEAFGLRSRINSGRPIDPEVRERYRQIMRDRTNGVTWETIEDRERIDARTLRDGLDLHRAALWLELLDDDDGPLLEDSDAAPKNKEGN